MSVEDTPRRVLLPIKDWDSFLVEAKEEFTIRYGLKTKSTYTRNQFDFIKTIGEGTFGRVYLARLVTEEKYYAVKTFDKAAAINKHMTKHILLEKKLLQAMNFPLCVYLEMTFQDNSQLYLGLPFIAGGEMFKHLRKLGKFNENLACFYGAQILLSLEYLHNCNVLYRDLKPENILIDQFGYLKLTDFGLSKIVTQRTYSLCGTPDYFAPEVLLNKGYGRSVDYWAFGVLLFEMVAGKPPFCASNVMKVYENILSASYSMPPCFSHTLADLIYNLLQIDVTKRFGNMKNGIEDIKNHKWFNTTEWILLINRKISPPFNPIVRHPGDTRNFDRIKEKKMKITRKIFKHEDFDEF